MDKSFNIKWDEIKNGHKGFEKLALEYVSDRFPNPTWEKTRETRDGNKDGVAYVFGYKSSCSRDVQWWMEAKYSTERKYISRYRLDATVVSSLFEDNIEIIVFVTNVLISAKTMQDVRRALLNSTNCRSVYFCTKYVLEYWLFNHQDIYIKYFNTKDINIKNVNYNSYFISQDIDFFDSSANRIVYTEPVKELVVGRIYIAHFSVYSPTTQTLKLRTKKCVGVRIQGKKEYVIFEGDNPIEFSIYIGEKAVNNSELVFYFGEKEVTTNISIRIISGEYHYFKIPSQEILIESVEKKVKEFNKSPSFSFNTISGICDSGKTYVLSRLTQSNLFKSDYLFQISFTGSKVENSKLLVNLILFILFPFINPDTIDKEYIYSISSPILSKELTKLISARNDFDELICAFKENSGLAKIFNNANLINKRFILIDDLHYLDTDCLGFFVKVISELSQRNLPILFVNTFEPDFLYREQYKVLSESICINDYPYELKIAELVGLFQKNKTNRYPIYKINTTVSITETLSFFTYIYNNNYSIDNLEECIIKYRLFQTSEIHKKHLLKLFNDIFHSHPNCRKLCDIIFTSHMPLITSVFDNYSSDLLILIKNDLIKYDYYNRVLPKNDIYRKFYLNNYKIDNDNIINSGDIESSEYHRLLFEKSISPDILQNYANKIIEQYENRKYNYVLYVLEDIFESEQKRMELKKRINNSSLFFQLYFAYSYSVHLQSSSVSSINHFENIIKYTKNNSDRIINKIYIKALWEMIICEYELLNYDNALLYIRELSVVLTKKCLPLSNHDSIAAFLKYHDAMTVKSQIEIDLYGEGRIKACELRTKIIRKYGFLDRYYNTKLRLSLAQLPMDNQTCINEIKKCSDYFLRSGGSDNKMYIIGQFSVLFYRMAFNNDLKIQEALINYHEKMKENQFHNYRKRCYAMASIFYLVGNIDLGDKYLFYELYASRKLPKRNLAFYYEALALHELKNNNTSGVLKALINAKSLFEELPSYSKIVDHDIHIINTYTIDNIDIQFWDGGAFNNSTFYIDPRITW